jgi:hypothetical protein
MPELATFDGAALIASLDAQRAERALDWAALADVPYAQSHDLNVELADNCLCSGALVRTARRSTMSCQYALILLRWIGRAPEDFLDGAVQHVGDTALPEAGPDRRLRFELPALHAALNRERQTRGCTWAELADVLSCTPARLTNLRTARLADMGLTMCVTQWLARPAADFVTTTRW